jgi:hypothetical protein
VATDLSVRYLELKLKKKAQESILPTTENNQELYPSSEKEKN